VAVHGSFVSWNDVATDGFMTAKWLRKAAPGRPLNVVLFSWKSTGPFTMTTMPLMLSALPQLDAELLGRRSAFVGLYLGRLIADLPAGHPVTLFGHSHGCRSVSSALHALGGGQVQGYVLADRPKHKRRIRAILAEGCIPVVAPVAVGVSDEPDRPGFLLNINADTVAGEVARAMGAERLIILTDVEGILDGSRRLIPRLTQRQAVELKNSRVVAGGMIPKIEACLRALERGAISQIIDGRKAGALSESMNGKPIGTRIG